MGEGGAHAEAVTAVFLTQKSVQVAEVHESTGSHTVLSVAYSVQAEAVTAVFLAQKSVCRWQRCMRALAATMMSAVYNLQAEAVAGLVQIAEVHLAAQDPPGALPYALSASLHASGR
eukprot:1145203-Pelagomonas_calceolata.AAC.1